MASAAEEGAGEAEREATLAFWSIKGVGPATLARLRERFGGLHAAVEAGAQACAFLLRSDAAKDLARQPDLRARAAEVRERCAQLGARILFRDDADWPARLADLGPHQPACLFVRGNCSGGRPQVTVVGSRQADPYGLSIAKRLGERLAQAGVCVVSGGAAGVDTAAHEGALAQGGPTWAVLGAGFEHPFPRSNEPLFDRIAKEGGAVLTELPPAFEVKEGNFPRRNRLVAALANAAVVVRGTAASGALITAREALALRRPVLAVPGNVNDALAEGPNWLLRLGHARACTSSEDVLRAVGLLPPLADVARDAGAPADAALDLPPQVPLDERLEGAYGAVRSVPRHFDEIARDARLAVPALASALTQLELLGLVEQRPGKLFVRT